jgi:hypothetical protein
MTTTELRRKVLEKLQVIAAGEGVHAADGVLVQDKYESLHEVLLHNNLVEWTITEDIPTEYESLMTAMVAAECVDEFYAPPELKAAIIGSGKYGLSPQLGGPSLAERQLRRLAAPSYAGEPVRSDYF